ncbi:hypothetical protein KIL84_020251 [Mauremys mutica]|uniref:Uncharacterized protein n=1 Tax=Mauremys mutica TaxID=74926 RepID=A0A9D3XX99_9SAUR|nr:hypothetical protein KIL84_020251 [Mauremys mutica]
MAPCGSSWLANEGSKHLCLLFWLSLNVWLFWKTFLLYYHGPQYYYLHQMLGDYVLAELQHLSST